jgi:DNA-binding SARP family transcriptional activator/uncharacterized protein HemY
MVPRFRSRRTIGLLGYLVVERRPIARDLLAALFWPDEAPSKGRANLSRELHNLAQILPGCWELDRQTAAFVPSADTTVDIDQLLNLSTQELWGEAVNLLGGEFLEGLNLNHHPEFENWLLGERERWRGHSEGVLKHVLDGHTRRGQYNEALHHAQRLLQLSPWDEDTHRHIMRLLAWTGQRGAALRQYESCKKTLREELEVEPASETVALFQQIQTGKLDLPPQLPAFLTEEKARHEYARPHFVGREDELDQLDGFIDAALAGQGRVIFITGSPGWGKTALLETFAQRAMEIHPNLLVASGNCNAYSGIGDPYLPYRDVMAMLTGDVEARWDAGAITRDHARCLWAAFSNVVQALLDSGPHLLDVFVPGVSLLSRSIASGGDHAPWLPRLRELVKHNLTGEKEFEQSHLFQQVTDVLVFVSRKHPLLLVLDDLQWGDAASISLLFHLGRRLAETESRLLIACAYRPEEVAAGRGNERHPLAKVLSEFKRIFGDVWVDLGRTENGKNRKFMDALLDIERNHLGEGFRKAFFNRTEGHPLFTIELLRAMQDRGELLKDADGAWIEGSTLDWGVLPARVEAVIGDRIDRLDPDLQEILTIASVEGEVFTANIVAEIQQVSERVLINRLSQELERQHGLVREQEEVYTGQRRMARYRFGHILYQDYLYKRLGHGERRILHGAVGTAQEKLYQGQLDEMAVQLAHHFHQAGDNGNAFHYFTMAGERAARLYESGEAIKNYTGAIELAEWVPPDITTRAKLHRGRGLAYERLGEFKRASNDHTTILQIAKQASDKKVEWRAFLDLGKLWASRDYNQARDYFESALDIARGLGEPALLGNSLNWIGNWYANAANPKRAAERHQEALNIFETLGNRRALASTLDLLGLASMLGSNLVISVEYYDRAITLFRALDDRPKLATSLIGRANTAVSLVWLSSVAATSISDAMRDIKEGHRIAGRINLASEKAWGFYSLGLLNLVRGHYGRALEFMENGLRFASEIEHREMWIGSMFALGTLYAELFAPDRAREQLEGALALARELCSQTWINIVSGALAAVYMMLDDYEAAKTCLDMVITPQTVMDTLGKRYCWIRRGELALVQDDPALALDITECLIASTPSLSPGRVVTFLWMLKGEALVALGHPEEAGSLLRAALENARATGERFLLWRVHASLGRLNHAMGDQNAAKEELSAARTVIDEMAMTVPDERLKDQFRQGAYTILKTCTL